RPKGDKQHPAEARIQRAMLSLESLLAAGNGFATPVDRKAVMQAENELSPVKQKELFRADEIRGRKIYSEMYLATKDVPNNKVIKESFAQAKGAAQLARLGGKLDAHDPSGETNATVAGMLRHLDQAGVSDQEQNALIDKLNFKLTIQGNQGQLQD